MTPTKLSIVRERRKTPRVDFPRRVQGKVAASPAVVREPPRRKTPRNTGRPRGRGALQHVGAQGPRWRFAANSVNLSGGGVCLRMSEALDIHSSLMLRLFTDANKRALQCAGKVAWVVQRLDLRDSPPFVYDVGVEFINPPASLRMLATHAGAQIAVNTESPAPKPQEGRPRGGTRRRATKGVQLQPADIHGRRYLPHVTQEASPQGRWHLVVTVDSVPCFSQRYASAREVTTAWQRFRRHTGKPATS